VNILMLGLGSKPGSWTIRGQQLGAAIGARVTSTPSDADYRWADFAVIVKRSEPRFGPEARRLGVPIVWDALDCWRQPTENGMSEGQARQQLKNHIKAIRPALVLGATQAQAEATGGVYLRHHSRPSLEPAPVQGRVSTVAYEGSPSFLGAWQPRIETACQARGWRFVINPPDLRVADIVVALREGIWDGWACRQWKSGVKFVNAIAAGRPILTQASAAFSEIQPPGSIVETEAELLAAFDAWESYESRSAALDSCRQLAPAYQLEAVAADYRQILMQVPCTV
jgi:hypothetical protein